MAAFHDAIQCVIFVSYFVISCIVGYVYIRHKKYIDTCANRLLLVTAGLFLMLCALTHLYSVWDPRPSETLLFSCALASFASAVCTVYTFRGLDDYLRQRVKTMDLLREKTITNLTKGYDLKVRVSGNNIVDGVAGPLQVTEPCFVADGFEVNGIVKVGEQFFRIANIVESHVQVMVNESNLPSRRRPPTQQHSLENGITRKETVAQVYGYDATAEVQMKDEAERMNRMKMELCMSTAHHVRSPLSCLGFALDSLRSRTNSEESLALMDEAVAHTEIINLVVTQFVDIATLDSSISMKPIVDHVDVRHLAERVEFVLMRIQMEGVRCACAVGNCVPNFVITDFAWVLQILLSIGTNAAKHTFSGWIRLNVTYDSGTLSIIATDTGVTIPDCEKRQIFYKDFTSNPVKSHGSTGIGLYSVKRKVVALGGKYDIVDNPGGGNILSVTIPVGVDEKCYTMSTEKRRDMVQVTRVRTILVVDDTPSVRKVMKRHLKDHRVEVAVNGADGLAKMKEKKFDIVLLDMMMPVLDGLGCLTLFREWERSNRPRDDHQLVFCVSATSVELDLGFDGSIPKPVDTKRLRAILQSLD